MSSRAPRPAPSAPAHDLFEAVQDRDLPALQAALLAGANTACERQGFTALKRAAQAGWLEGLLLLIEAERQEKSLSGFRAFSARARRAARDWLHQWRDGRCDGWADAMFAAARQNALSHAADARSLPCVEALLGHEDPKAPNLDGSTALMRAALSGSPPILAALLPHSDPGALDHHGCDALMRSAQGKSLECVLLLLPLSDPRRRALDGSDALMIAATLHCLPIVHALAPLSDPSACDDRGRSALSIALDSADPQLLAPIAAISPRSALVQALECETLFMDRHGDESRAPCLGLLRSILESRDIDSALAPAALRPPAPPSRRL